MNPEALARVVDQHRLWLASGGAEGSHAGLAGAELRGVALWRADLRGADLAGADLRHANLDHAQLAGARLQCANLAGASLWQADLSGAKLAGADLRGAKLDHALLHGADLHGADLTGASVWGAQGIVTAPSTEDAHLGGPEAEPSTPSPASATRRALGEVAWETWDDPALAARSPLRWRILFSGDRTPTAGLCMGLAELPPGGILPLHHHDPAEVYHVLAGEGVAEVEGERHALSPGVALFIPGRARHRTTNIGAAPLRLVFTFLTDRYEDAIYHFDE